MAKKKQPGPTPARAPTTTKAQAKVKAQQRKAKNAAVAETSESSKKSQAPKNPSQKTTPATTGTPKTKKKKAKKAVKPPNSTGSKPVGRVRKVIPLVAEKPPLKDALSRKITVSSSSVSTANASSSQPPEKQSCSEDWLFQLAASSSVPISAKIERQFYESHLLLYVLGQVRGEHKKRQSYTGELDRDEISLRRSFLDKLAYICDYTKNGTTVTALALQKTFDSVVFWLAANETVRPAVIELLTNVLLLLKNNSAASKKEMEAQLLALIVPFSKVRLDYYWHFLSRDLPLCIEYLKSPDIVTNGKPTIKELTSLTNLLSGLPRLSGKRVELVKECFEARKNPTLTSNFETLAQLSTKGKAHSKFFGDIRHLLGRLGEHVKATKTLVAAALRFPDILDEFTIKVHPSPPSKSYFKSSDSIAIKGMASRIFSQKAQVGHYQEALERLQVLSDGALLGLLQQEFSFKTRVHAEALLADLFYWAEFEFFDDDAYIGCSKPACFNCYQYISSHPRKFVLPACHNKLYLNWRSPDILREAIPTSRQSEVREAITMTMNARIQEELREQIDGKFSRRAAQPDSVTGTSSSTQRVVLGPLATEDENEDDNDSQDHRGALLNTEQLVHEDNAAWETDESDDDLTWYGVEKNRVL